jgi:hypothetical protein
MSIRSDDAVEKRAVWFFEMLMNVMIGVLAHLRQVFDMTFLLSFGQVPDPEDFTIERSSFLALGVFFCLGPRRGKHGQFAGGIWLILLAFRVRISSHLFGWICTSQNNERCIVGGTNAT